MNFIETFNEGQKGGSRGLYMGEGLKSVSQVINGVQKAKIYGVGAAPKAGKTTFADYGFVIEPYLDAVKCNIPFEVIYFSYEIDRVSKEFDFASHFISRDFGITEIELPEGTTKEGSSIIEMSSDYLMGRIQDDDNNIIKINSEVQKALKIVYETRIVPLFGEFAKDGTRIKKGIIDFNEDRENPTGIWKYLLNYAKENGTIKTKTYTNKEGNKKQKVIGYTPNDADKIVLVIIDHLRKVKEERGFTLKQTVDKTIAYSVELRNQFKFSFLHIIHLNRNMTDINRIRYSGDMLYPNSDDIKDSGNLPEECNYMFTMFNPNDERYNLNKHFGKNIKDGHGNELFPNMRTLHLVESRHCTYPQHFRLNMFGNIKNFEKLNI